MRCERSPVLSDSSIPIYGYTLLEYSDQKTAPLFSESLGLVMQGVGNESRLLFALHFPGDEYYLCTWWRSCNFNNDFDEHLIIISHFKFTCFGTNLVRSYMY